MIHPSIGKEFEPIYCIILTADEVKYHLEIFLKLVSSKKMFKSNISSTTDF